MKSLDDPAIDQYRRRTREVLNLYGSFGDGTAGAFLVPSPIDRQPLVIIASTGEGWDHVSVSRKNRVPNWYEMDFVKRLFFRPEEEAFQFHPPEAEHVNVHPHCLHLWRPQDFKIPQPLKEAV